MGIFIVWVILSAIVGLAGSSKKIGFGGAFALSLLLSPVIGLIIALLDKKRNKAGAIMSPAMAKLVREADRNFQRKEYSFAIDNYSKALMYSKSAPATNYKLAKAYSINGNAEKSLKHLTTAIEDGFKDFDKIHSDVDLEYLRKQEIFKAFVSNNYKKLSTNTDTVRPLTKVEELEKLASLFEKGVITKGEFEIEKAKLLSK